MSIKLVALDLDGTTLNDDRVISGRNRKAMTRAAEEGVSIVIATGRPLMALPEDVFEIEAIRYALTSNGASITDIRKNETFYENCLSPRAVEASVDLLRKHDYVLETFVKGIAYIEGWYYEEIKRTGSCFRSVDYILNTRKPVDDIYAFMLENRDSIENINVNFEDISEKPAMYEKLIRLPETTITSSFDHNLEIGGETTSKAEALNSDEPIGFTKVQRPTFLMALTQKALEAYGHNLPEGCVFADRCAYATEECRKTAQKDHYISPTHMVRCSRYLEPDFHIERGMRDE